MSLEWFKLYHSITRHPKTLHLAALLKVQRAHRFVIDIWLWQAEEKRGGNVAGLPNEVLAAAAGWEGDPALFVASLRAAGWLDEDGRLHEWDIENPEHAVEAEQVAEKKALKKRDPNSPGARRSREYRERKAASQQSCDGRRDASQASQEASRPPSQGVTSVTESPRSEIEDLRSDEEQRARDACDGPCDASQPVTPVTPSAHRFEPTLQQCQNLHRAWLARMDAIEPNAPTRYRHFSTLSVGAGLLIRQAWLDPLIQGETDPARALPKAIEALLNEPWHREGDIGRRELKFLLDPARLSKGLSLLRPKKPVSPVAQRSPEERPRQPVVTELPPDPRPPTEEARRQIAAAHRPVFSRSAPTPAEGAA